MASITLTGSLLDPDGFVSIGDQVRFTHKSNTGSTIKSAVSVITIPPSGNYNITLQYGIVRVEYKDILTGVYKDVGVVTVNQDNPATTLPELLNAAVPPSSQEMIEFQAILADCVQEANNASQSAAEAEQAVVDIEALTGQQTTTELINSSTSYDADKVLETSGFNAAGDGCAGKWKQNGVTGQTPSQTPAQTGKATFNDGNGNQWELVREKNDIHLSKLGAKEGDDITDIFKAAVSEIANNGGKIKLPYALEDNPCKISSTVTIRSDVTVYGESVFNSWLKQEDNANTNLLNAQNRDNNCFRDFSVDLNGSNNTAGNSINAGDCTKLKLINLSIKDAIKNIVLIQDCTNFNMSNISAYGGGYYPDDNRGYELAGVENFNIKNISTKNYTGAGINLSRCNNGVLSGLNFTRDFSQGFTNGFAGVRFSNSSSNITLGDFYIDGFSRGVTVTTGEGSQTTERSNSISISNGTVDNSGYSSLWVVAEPVTSQDKTRKIAISNIFAGTSGLDVALSPLDEYTVALSNVDEVKISGLVTKGDALINGTINCIISSSIINGDLTESSDDLIADKNIITSNRVLGSISTVGVNTLKENNIEGA